MGFCKYTVIFYKLLKMYWWKVELKSSPTVLVPYQACFNIQGSVSNLRVHRCDIIKHQLYICTVTATYFRFKVTGPTGFPIAFRLDISPSTSVIISLLILTLLDIIIATLALCLQLFRTSDHYFHMGPASYRDIMSSLALSQSSVYWFQNITLHQYVHNKLHSIRFLIDYECMREWLKWSVNVIATR